MTVEKALDIHLARALRAVMAVFPANKQVTRSLHHHHAFNLVSALHFLPSKSLTVHSYAGPLTSKRDPQIGAGVGDVDFQALGSTAWECIDFLVHDCCRSMASCKSGVSLTND